MQLDIREQEVLTDEPNLQLTETYRNSLVGDAFDRIDIEAFSKGSVLVDYYVYFKHFDEQVSEILAWFEKLL